MQRTSMYATVAAGAGIISTAEFVEIATAQLPLIIHMEREMEAFYRIKNELSEQERFSLSIFGHDILSRTGTFINGWSSVSRSRGKTDRWLEVASVLYNPFPTLRAYLQGLANARLFQRSGKSIIFWMETDESLIFKSAERFSKARIIFENLVDNAVKYGDRFIGITLKGSDLIFENGGMGMDPAFAERLGHGEQIREGRAEGVSGDGIGWASIGKLMQELGWSWEIETGIDKGTKVTVHMIEGDLIPFEVASAQSSGRVQITGMVPANEIVRGAEVFKGVRPFAGYEMMNGPRGEYLGSLSVVSSPIYTAIGSANLLIGPWMGTPFFMPSGLLP